MAVDQQNLSGLREHGVGEGGEGAVVGNVDLLDAPARVGEIQPAAVDVLALGDDAGNGAEAACHARRTGVGIARQVAREHARVEFIGLAVEIDVAPRRQGPQHGRAVVHAGEEKLVHEAILGFPQASSAAAVSGGGNPPGKSRPLCGELNTAGAVHSAGARISKGREDGLSGMPSRFN